MLEKTTQESEYITVIRPKNGLFDLNLKEVWRYRDLIWIYTKRTFALTYKQTVLGPIWIFLNPFITSLIYVLVFGGIAGIPTDGIPQMLFYLGGNAVWTFFSSSLTKTATTFTANANVFGKVYFPRLTLPISTVLSSAINFVVQMILFMAFWIYYLAVGQIHPNFAAILALPLVLLQVGALALGCGIIISSLTTKYRDLAILVTFGVQLWMYITPVVYPISTLGDGLLRTILLLNPVTCGVEAFRYMFLGQGLVDPVWWLWSIGITLVVLLVGIVLFSRVEKTFMDTV
ncbi:ABC-2 type transporter [Pseudoflavonifractor capillosus ATCC 29799]|uniref:Transport permease protein n=1 Tax=Pseudoflavonifractor capillosus ATCC 29799 TaxID=411467 RepID=A6NTS5_9FIRM|nr:ABC transporter permease [Pseudoflavonifractor capillosus]EDN00838.1 ABC-2 type transporter [Pseudoflavonifractor capillosus ATCC 29799]